MYARSSSIIECGSLWARQCRSTFGEWNLFIMAFVTGAMAFMVVLATPGIVTAGTVDKTVLKDVLYSDVERGNLLPQFMVTYAVTPTLTLTLALTCLSFTPSPCQCFVVPSAPRFLPADIRSTLLIITAPLHHTLHRTPPLCSCP